MTATQTQRSQVSLCVLKVWGKKITSFFLIKPKIKKERKKIGTERRTKYYEKVGMRASKILRERDRELLEIERDRERRESNRHRCTQGGEGGKGGFWQKLQVPPPLDFQLVCTYGKRGRTSELLTLKRFYLFPKCVQSQSLSYISILNCFFPNS